MNIYAFFITSVAGLFTIIGSLIIFYKGNKENIICKSLSFASGVMLSISITDLSPNSLKLILSENNRIISILMAFFSMFIGILVSMMLKKEIKKNSTSKSKLYKLGLITMITIIIHNIPEGIATYITTDNNTNLGLVLAIAIAMHNIPEGISVSIPIYYSTNSKFKSILYTFISGISESIGAIIAYIFLSKIMTNTLLGILYSLIAGIMINISINELFKESYKLNKKHCYIYFIIGFTFMIINHLLFN